MPDCGEKPVRLPVCGNTELIESGDRYWGCDVNLKGKCFFVDRASKDDIPIDFWKPICACENPLFLIIGRECDFVRRFVM